MNLTIPPKPAEPYRFECVCGARYETSEPPPFLCGVCNRLGVMVAERQLWWTDNHQYPKEEVK